MKKRRWARVPDRFELRAEATEMKPLVLLGGRKTVSPDVPEQ